MFKYYLVLQYCIFVYKTRLISGIKGDVDNDSFINVVYYEIKPYIFQNSKGELDGIYPMIMDQAITHCLNETHQKTRIAKFVKKFDSRESFRSTLQGNYSAHGEYEGHIWFPLTFKSITESFKRREHKDQFRVFTIVNVKNLAVIVARDNISLITKVAGGLQTCSLIFFIAFQMAVFFGILLWLLERNSDGGFPKGYIKGITTGLWWSFSLGYNDIVPKTVIGRLMGAVWVAMIVLVASIMTASITNSVTGGVNFSINGNKVAFLKDSWELNMVQRDYTITPVEAESYQEVIQKVRSGKAFAAVIDENVAAWYKESILDDNAPNPLRIVDKLPVKIFVDDLVPKTVPEELESIFACMLTNKIDVYDRPLNTFYRSLPIETLYLDPIPYLVRNNRFVQGLLLTVCVFLIIGFVLAVYTKHQKIRQNMAGTVRGWIEKQSERTDEDQVIEAKPLRNDSHSGV